MKGVGRAFSKFDEYQLAKDNRSGAVDTLACLLRAFSWPAVRTDDFFSRFKRGMARTKPTERTRDRVLSEEELGDLWAALDIVKNVPVCYPGYVRTLLLTAMAAPRFQA